MLPTWLQFILAKGFQRRRLKCEKLTDVRRRKTNTKWWQKLTLPLTMWAKTDKRTKMIYKAWIKPILKKINVRENQRGNQEWRIQNHRQHWVHKTQDEDKTKHNTETKKTRNTDPTRKPEVHQGTREGYKQFLSYYSYNQDVFDTTRNKHA